MRKLNIKTWKSKLPEGGESKDSLIHLIKAMMSDENSKIVLFGVETFEVVKKVDDALLKAEKTKVLELDEESYDMLSNFIEQFIPSYLGINTMLAQQVESFLSLEKEKVVAA